MLGFLFRFDRINLAQQHDKIQISLLPVVVVIKSATIQMMREMATRTTGDGPHTFIALTVPLIDPYYP